MPFDIEAVKNFAEKHSKTILIIGGILAAYLAYRAYAGNISTAATTNTQTTPTNGGTSGGGSSGSTTGTTTSTTGTDATSDQIALADDSTANTIALNTANAQLALDTAQSTAQLNTQNILNTNSANLTGLENEVSFLFPSGSIGNPVSANSTNALTNGNTQSVTDAASGKPGLPFRTSNGITTYNSGNNGTVAGTNSGSSTSASINHYADNPLFTGFNDPHYDTTQSYAISSGSGGYDPSGLITGQELAHSANPAQALFNLSNAANEAQYAETYTTQGQQNSTNYNTVQLATTAAVINQGYQTDAAKSGDKVAENQGNDNLISGIVGSIAKLFG